MGDIPGEPAAVLLPLRRRDRLRRDEEQRVGPLQGLWLCDLRRALIGQRGAAERAASARRQVSGDCFCCCYNIVFLFGCVPGTFKSANLV